MICEICGKELPKIYSKYEEGVIVYEEYECVDCNNIEAIWLS